MLSINAKFQFELGCYHSSSIYALLQPAFYSKWTVNHKTTTTTNPFQYTNGNCKNLHERVNFLKSNSWMEGGFSNFRSLLKLYNCVLAHVLILTFLEWRRRVSYWQNYNYALLGLKSTNQWSCQHLSVGLPFSLLNPSRACFISFVLFFFFFFVRWAVLQHLRCNFYMYSVNLISTLISFNCLFNRIFPTPRLFL